MRASRRQFLFALGLLASTGCGVLNRQTSEPEAARSPLPPSPAPEPTPAPNPTPAPDGLFAPERGRLRLAAISDLNSQYGSTEYEPEVDRAIALLPDWEPDLVLCGGDMVAGQYPALIPEQMQAMWDAFDAHIGAPLRSAGLPFGFTIGNHDASGALAVNGNFLFARERDTAAAYWTDPARDPGLDFVDRAGFPFYYSFRLGDAFFLTWDASTFKIPAEQLAWAERSLASEAARSARLRMAIGHLPLYAVAVGRNEPGEVLSDGDGLRSLLERYDVSTYISGHHHAYYPAHRGQLELLHAGALGGGPRPLIDSGLPTRKTLTILDADYPDADDEGADDEGAAPENGAAGAIAAAPTLRYTTYDMQTLEVVNQQELPRYINGTNGMVLRRDVEWTSLSPQERAIDPTYPAPTLAAR